MVASHDDNGAPALAEECGKEIVVLSLSSLRWIAGIEDVTRDKQEVNALLADAPEEKLEEASMLVLARVLPEHFAKMPIGSVQDAIGSAWFGWRCGHGGNCGGWWHSCK